MRRRRPGWTAQQRARYAEAHGRLCLWKDDTVDERLEICLTRSPDLYRNILELLCALGQTFLNGSHEMHEGGYSNRETKLTTAATYGKAPIFHDINRTFDDLVRPLETLIEKGSNVLENLGNRDSTPSSESETSDIESEAEEETADDQIEKFIRAIQTRTKLLIDICPSLEQTYGHANKPTKPQNTAPPIFHVSEAAQHYVRRCMMPFQMGIFV